ncbi:MAG: SDR family NAD(P)-dependent oxidoreductase [Alteraurantiacibacter sp.]
MSTPTEFTGKRALITGAASGIGAACARWLAAQGVSALVLVDRDAPALSALDLPCEVLPYPGDVTDEALWERIEAEAGPLDYAVINAGIAGGAAIAEMTLAEWRATLSVNLDGAFLALRCATRLIRDRGAMVLTASVSGIKAEPGTAAYGASKAGLMQLGRVAAKELAPRRVRVNCIAPGGVDTPIWDQTPFFQDMVTQHGGDRAAAMAALSAMATPLGRYASADEVAGQIGFLLSDAAATITGTALVSDGGYLL